MRLIEIVGGASLMEAATRLADHAQRTGEAVSAQFGNTFLAANPGQTAEVIAARHREDAAAKSAWLQSPDGVRYLESRRTPA